MGEISADLVARALVLSIWLTGAEALRLMPTGFWVRIADADVFFGPVGTLFNRARFEAKRVLQATDPAPRSPDVWLLQTRPLGLATGVQP